MHSSRVFRVLSNIPPMTSQPLRTVAVLGGSYAGSKAAKSLVESLPSGWRTILIDKNKHVHHVYNFPRSSILSGHEHKAFIPRNNAFGVESKDVVPYNDELEKKRPFDNKFLNAEVLKLSPTSVTLSKSFPELGFPSKEIHFDYALYALGALMPDPLDMWGCMPGGAPLEKATGLAMPKYDGSKQEGIEWLKASQKVLAGKDNILIVGGGALGIQMATDLKDLYPNKKVTLLHSRDRLLPKFDSRMHDEIKRRLDTLSIDVILGERLNLESIPDTGLLPGGKVFTTAGRAISSDFILLCTGQNPNTSLLRSLSASLINPENNRARVLRSLQVSEDGKTSPHPNIFVIGDSADAFGAVQSGRCAFHQAEVAVGNIVKLIKAEDEVNKPVLTDYVPHHPIIKVSLGMRHSVSQMGEDVQTSDKGTVDLGAASMWRRFGLEPMGEEDLFA